MPLIDHPPSTTNHIPALPTTTPSFTVSTSSPSRTKCCGDCCDDEPDTALATTATTIVVNVPNHAASHDECTSSSAPPVVVNIAPTNKCEDECCSSETHEPVAVTATTAVTVHVECDDDRVCRDKCCGNVGLGDMKASPASVIATTAGSCADACCSSKKPSTQNKSAVVCDALDYPTCCVEAVCRDLAAPLCCSRPQIHLASSPFPTTATTATSMKPAERLYNWRRAALAVSFATIVWNIIEGSLGLVYGAENVSVALLGFGADSWVEVLSAIAVTYRFWHIETNHAQSTAKEKRATLVIGVLLFVLAICIVGGSIAALTLHEKPDSDTASIAISATAIAVMAVLYFTKVHIALALSSSTLESDAQCSLCCIQLSSVLFIGSLVTRFAGDVVWWFDGATALVIALLVGREGFDAIRNARRKDFNGCGCCDEDSGWYIRWLRKNRQQHAQR